MAFEATPNPSIFTPANAAARQAANRGAIIGSRVLREPEGSTARYTAWANGMSSRELELHRFRECTLLMPTWFIARRAFVSGGGFREEVCEDLLFLLAHVRRGGALDRCLRPCEKNPG